jgi:hypothetical protein
MIKVTSFACGGIAIGVLVSYTIADIGTAFVYFSMAGRPLLGRHVNLESRWKLLLYFFFFFFLVLFKK